MRYTCHHHLFLPSLFLHRCHPLLARINSGFKFIIRHTECIEETLDPGERRCIQSIQVFNRQTYLFTFIQSHHSRVYGHYTPFRDNEPNGERKSK